MPVQLWLTIPNHRNLLSDTLGYRALPQEEPPSCGESDSVAGSRLYASATQRRTRDSCRHLHSNLLTVTV